MSFTPEMATTLLLFAHTMLAESGDQQFMRSQVALISYRLRVTRLKPFFYLAGGCSKRGFGLYAGHCGRIMEHCCCKKNHVLR